VGGCWRHLRRKLFEARGASGDVADIGIHKVRGLFRVEHEATASASSERPNIAS